MGRMTTSKLYLFGSPHLEQDEKPVDLGRQDEIVLRQAADRMGPQLDRHVAITLDVQVRMMAVRFGHQGTTVEEVDAGREVLD